MTYFFVRTNLHAGQILSICGNWERHDTSFNKKLKRDHVELLMGKKMKVKLAAQTLCGTNAAGKSLITYLLIIIKKFPPTAIRVHYHMNHSLMKSSRCLDTAEP